MIKNYFIKITIILLSLQVLFSTSFITYAVVNCSNGIGIDNGIGGCHCKVDEIYYTEESDIGTCPAIGEACIACIQPIPTSVATSTPSTTSTPIPTAVPTPTPTPLVVSGKLYCADGRDYSELGLDPIPIVVTGGSNVDIDSDGLYSITLNSNSDKVTIKPQFPDEMIDAYSPIPVNCLGSGTQVCSETAEYCKPTNSTPRYYDSCTLSSSYQKDIFDFELDNCTCTGEIAIDPRVNASGVPTSVSNQMTRISAAHSLTLAWTFTSTN